jgi:hypothetical protein
MPGVKSPEPLSINTRRKGGETDYIIAQDIDRTVTTYGHLTCLRSHESGIFFGGRCNLYSMAQGSVQRIRQSDWEGRD